MRQADPFAGILQGLCSDAGREAIGIEKFVIKTYG
jgi:hypothetical protein